MWKYIFCQLQSLQQISFKFFHFRVGWFSWRGLWVMAFMHLSSIEVYQHHNEHTQTNAHKDVRVPNAHSAPPCSIHNRIWKSRPRVVLYVASSKSKVFWFLIFLLYTQRALQRSNVLSLFTIRNIQRNVSRPKIGGVWQTDARKLTEKGQWIRRFPGRGFYHFEKHTTPQTCGEQEVMWLWEQLSRLTL